MTKRTLFILILITAVAAFLRLYRFEGFVTYLGDQGRDAIIIKQIVTLEHLPAIGAPSSIGGVYLGPFYYYLVAPFLPLFAYNPVGLAYGVAFISIIATVLATLAIRKETQNDSLSISFFILAATSFVLIELSRFSWNPNLLPFFSFFTLYFFYKWTQKTDIWNALLFGAFFSFSIQLHYLSTFIGLTMGIYGLVAIIQSKQKKRFFLTLIPGILSFIFFSSPLIIFDLRHDFLNSTNFFKLFTEDQLSGGSSRIGSLIETTHAFIQHGLQMQISAVAALIISILLLVAGGFYGKLAKNKFILLHTLNIICFLIGFSFLASPRHFHYFGPVYLSLYLLIVAIPFIFKNSLLKYTILSIFLIYFLILNTNRYYYFTSKPNNQIEHSEKVANFLAGIIEGNPYNISTWPVSFVEDPYTYFLELKGMRPADRKKLEITKQMFVLCAEEPCMVINSPSWNISMFGEAEITNTWEVDSIKIYRLEHKTNAQ